MNEENTINRERKGERKEREGERERRERGGGGVEKERQKGRKTLKFEMRASGERRHIKSNLSVEYSLLCNSCPSSTSLSAQLSCALLVRATRLLTADNKEVAVHRAANSAKKEKKTQHQCEQLTHITTVTTVT